LIAYREALKTARSAYLSNLLEQNKHNLRCIFETVAKLTKKKASSSEVSKQHSSNDFMNFFTFKIDNIRDKINNGLSTTVSHQGVHCCLPEERLGSFAAIGEDEFCKLVNSSKSTTCMQYARPYTD